MLKQPESDEQRARPGHSQQLDHVSNVQEVEKGDENIVTVRPESGEVVVAELKTKVDLAKYTETHRFVFDDSLDHSVDNDTVYCYSVQPLVQTIFRAGKATCFAYGQTGSGKTFTMSPLPPRAAAEILDLLSTRHPNLDLFVSCFEIYGNKVRSPCTLPPLMFGKPLLNNVLRFDHVQLQK